jgi:transposase
MYSIEIIKASINLYFKLLKNNIIGKNRIDIIKKTFNIHINTLYNWINKYYNNNIFDFNNYKTNYKYNNIKITSNIEQFIIKSIETNNNFNIRLIQKNIKNKFNIYISISSIYYVLHKNNLTYKKLTVKNNPYNNDQIKEFKVDLNTKLNKIDKNNIYSYDEMSIYLNSKPYKGWSLKGNECCIKTKNKTIFNKRFTLGLAIDINSNFNFTIVEGALKSHKFNTFMTKIMKNNKYIFMDNATIHKNYYFKQHLINNNLTNNVIYNIPYHSHYNPIEYVFSLLRKLLLSNDNTTLNNIISIIVNFCKSLNKNIILNIFNKCFNEISNIN